MAESANPWKIVFILRCERVADGMLVRFDYGTGLVLASNPNYKRCVEWLGKHHKNRSPSGIRLKDGVIEDVGVLGPKAIIQVCEAHDPVLIITSEATWSYLSRSHLQFEELLTQLKQAAGTGQSLWCLEDGYILAVHPYEWDHR